MKSITHIADLVPDHKNARKHNPRNIGMIVDALHEVGAARSIVIDEDGRILAGNGTIDAAAEAGIERVQVVEADGETIVAVRRTGLTEEQKTRLALYDNRASDTAEWDASVLAELAQEGVKLDDLWVPDELDELLASVSATPEPGDGGDEFDTTPEDGPTTVQPGDLWALGPHRLLCGDSTKAEDVARLMAGEKASTCITDPPYGVNYAERNMARDGNAKVTMTYHEGVNAEPLDALRYAPPIIVMTYPIDCHFFALAKVLSDCGYEFNRELVWVKSRPIIVLGSYYNQQHEPILVLCKKGVPLNANTKMKLSTVFFTEKATAHEDHPTAKPLELWCALVENHTAPDSLIYEPFSGGGTTIIAAHRTGRKCYGIEIEPKYCDVILKRYTAETGEEPKLLERANGTA